MLKKINLIGRSSSVQQACDSLTKLGFDCEWEYKQDIDVSDKSTLALYEFTIEDDKELNIPEDMATAKDFQNTVEYLKKDNDDKIMCQKIIDALSSLDDEAFEDKLYYDQGEELDISRVNEFRTFGEFIGASRNELTDLNYQYVQELIKQNLSDHLLSLELKDEFEELDREYQEEIREFYNDNCYIDVVSDLLRRAPMLRLNIFPYQEKNLGSEGSELREAIRDFVEKLQGNQEIIVKNELLEKLFKSQGYDINKVTGKEDSKFIKSFITEIDNIWSDYPMFFTCMAKMSIEEYFKFVNGETELDFKGTCGLFNPIQGSSSVLEVELEKPFMIKFTGDEDRFGVQVEEAKKCYGYSVNDVCDFPGYVWNNK